jgi:hypothetical protein
MLQSTQNKLYGGAVGLFIGVVVSSVYCYFGSSSSDEPQPGQMTGGSTTRHTRSHNNKSKKHRTKH